MKNNNLPEFCYGEDTCNPGSIIVLKKGMSGYYPSDLKGDFMHYNKQIGVSREQAEAMKVGSMFSWDVPGANPEFYKGKFEVK